MTPAARLVRRNLLDPREAGEAAAAPLADSVNIPFAELPQRTHELPPKSEVISVTGSAELAARVIAWLEQGGRQGRYVAGEPARPQVGEIGRLWQPNAFLAEVAGGLTPGRALDLGCGTGRDAIYLASCGWQVTGVDVLPDALTRARDLARRCAAACGPLEWLCADLETAPPTFAAEFDLIVMLRYLHRPLLARVADWLRPGGSFLCEFFTTTHRDRHGRPANAAAAHELADLLAGWRILHHSEAWRGDRHTVRIWATPADRVDGR
ncbi:MAG: class I SAM-dependent methyltransferase [Phycisphaerae bacterium]|jgi:SAM-dependent methyltransferase